MMTQPSKQVTQPKILYLIYKGGDDKVLEAVWTNNPSEAMLKISLKLGISPMELVAYADQDSINIKHLH